MRIHFRCISEQDARTVLAWQYDPPYDVYNVPPEDQEAAIPDLLEPTNCYHSMHAESGELIGFCCFGPDARVPGGDYDGSALDVGIGLQPDLTGQGLGASAMSAALDFAREHMAATAFRTTVAAFNRRAIRAYERAGFQEQERFRNSAGSEWAILHRVS